MLNNQELTHKIVAAIGITGGGLLISFILLFYLKKWSRKRQYFIPGLIDKYLVLPGVLLFLVISLNIDLESFRNYLNDRTYGSIKHGLHILLIAMIGFLLLRLISILKNITLRHFQNQERKDYKLRSVKTKFQLIQRITKIAIIIGTLSIILMTFNNVKQIGGALLASAGVAGIVIGFAAQKSLGSLLAGIQIAVSQPIKIDDTVIVENTYGIVGEITLTYVVINTWDEKKLIVPINYFLEKPFENWTRISPEVTGKVTLTTDYSMPIKDIRQEFLSLLNESPLWDKRKADLLVINANDKTMELRAIMSAKNAEDAFQLECFVREMLVTYIRKNIKGL